MNDSVHLRNAKALNERNKQDRVRHDELLQRVQHLENQVTMLRSENEQLRQQVYGILAARGTGPTSRSSG